MTALIVIAKAPVPGRVKTRLCPPCTPEQAAVLAAASLADTLDVVAAQPADRHVCVLEGEPGPWLPDRFDVIPQRGDGLDARLAAAFEDVGDPALLVGMDTPQLTPEHLGAGLEALTAPGCDAVLGLAPDGGYWAIGLRRPDRRLFAGVPMSTEHTGAAQRERLIAHGLRITMLPELRDVDTIDDARAVADVARPGSRFAAALRRIDALEVRA